MQGHSLPCRPQPLFLDFALDEQVKLRWACHATARVYSLPANCHVIERESQPHVSANIGFHFHSRPAVADRLLSGRARPNFTHPAPLELSAFPRSEAIQSSTSTYRV